MAGDVQNLIIQLKAQGINVTEKQLRRLGGQAKKTGNSLMGMVGAVGGIYAIGRAFSFVVGVGSKFSSSQSNLAAIVGTTKDQLGALDKTARELGASTKFTASQVVELQTEFAKLGFSSEQIVAAQEATLSLASAVNVDLATAAEVSGQMVNAFGLGAEQTDRVVNVMAASFSSSALDMDKFTNSMTYVSAIAKQTGVSIEATTGVLGKLADVGIDGSIAGTALRKVMLEMGNESSKLARKVGFAVKSDEDLFKALKILNEEGLSTAQMEDLVGKRAISAFANMMTMSEGAEELTEKITGTKRAAEMAAEQMDNLEGDQLKLQSATEGLSIELYDQFEPALRSATQAMTSFIGWLDPAILKGLIISLGLAGTAFVVLKIKAHLASKGIKTARKAMQAFAASSGGLMLALMAISTVVVALAGGFGEAREQSSTSLSAITDAVYSSASSIGKHSKTARMAAIDWGQIYEDVENNVISLLHVDDEVKKAEILNSKKALKQKEEEYEVYDILATGIDEYTKSHKDLTNIMATGSDKSVTFTSVLKANDDMLQKFKFTNADAGKILQNVTTYMTDLGDSMEVNVSNREEFYKTVGLNRWVAQMDTGVKLGVKNLGNLDKASQKVNATFNEGTYIVSDASYGKFKSWGPQKLLKEQNDLLGQSAKYMSTYKYQWEGAIASKDLYLEDLRATGLAMVQVEDVVNRGFSSVSVLEFENALDLVKNKTGEVDDAFLKTFYDVEKGLTIDIASLEAFIMELEDFFEQHMTERWAKVVEAITAGVEKIEQAEQKEQNTRNITIATNLAHEKGVDSLTQSHMQYIQALVEAEDINGQKKYTDEQILLLAKNLEVTTKNGAEVTKEATLAQIAFSQAKKDFTEISVQEEGSMINSLLSLDQQNSTFKVTVHNIDEYVDKMKKAILAGKTMEEALESATGVAGGVLTDKEISKRKETEEQMLKDYAASAQEITDSANELEYETKIRQDEAIIDAEWTKLKTLTEFKALSDEEKLKLEDDYDKKKDVLEKKRTKGDKLHVASQISLFGELGGALAGFWQVTGKNAEMVTNLQYIQAIANTYTAATKALEEGGGWPKGAIQMGITIIQGLAQVAQIAKARDEAKAAASQSLSAEYGANFVTDGLTNLIVGDNPGGKEMVNVTPLSSPNMYGDETVGGGTTLNVTVQGNVMSKDFVEDELVDSLNEAIRKGNIITS